MIGMGDLAQHLLMRRSSTSLNTDLSRLVQEMSTGQKADRSNPVTGGYRILGDLEKQLHMSLGYTQAVAELAPMLDAMQTSLGLTQDLTSNLAQDLVSLAETATEVGTANLSKQAENAFRDLVGALNASVSGRTLFGGTATNQAALATADSMLSSLRGATATSLTPQDFRTAIEDWFSGIDFAQDGFQGNSQPMKFRIGEGERVEVVLTADDPAIRTLLQETAIAALAEGHPPGFDLVSKKTLLKTAGEGLLSGQEALVQIRSSLGAQQERTEQVGVRNAARVSVMEQTRSDLSAVDPYETATRLEATRLQIESLYTLTARLSGLNLSTFLR